MRVWRAFWRSRRKQPMSADSCRTCDKQLRHGEIWEAREHLEDTPELAGFGGGTFLAIPYCRRHKPRGAVRS